MWERGEKSLNFPVQFSIQTHYTNDMIKKQQERRLDLVEVWHYIIIFSAD